MTKIADAALVDAIGGPNPIVGIRRKDASDSVGSLLREVARRPGQLGLALGRLAPAAAEVLRGTSSIRPDARDRRRQCLVGLPTGCTAGSAAVLRRRGSASR